MSHFTTIRTQIRDIDALRGACTELGFQLIQNAEARGFFQSTKGEYVIQLKGPYDIAVNKQPDETQRFIRGVGVWSYGDCRGGV